MHFPLKKLVAATLFAASLSAVATPASANITADQSAAILKQFSETSVTDFRSFLGTLAKGEFGKSADTGTAISAFLGNKTLNAEQQNEINHLLGIYTRVKYGKAALETLRELVDAGCHLVLTTGGTGPALRDVTPEATLAVADKELPGFGEQMRQISLRFVPTAILSRQVAVVRASSLIINLPGQPKAIAETLEGLKDAQGHSLVPGIFAAVPYCIDLIGGPYIYTHEAVCAAFRPKNAQRPLPA